VSSHGYASAVEKGIVFSHGVLSLCALLYLEMAEAQGIFTCTDAKGKRLTSDRPIAECADREQRELNKSGTVRRNMTPTLTAVERAQLEAASKEEAEERNREIEERKRSRSLLVRYPNRASHDKERELALQQVNRVGDEAKNRVAELMRQAKALELETDFYKTSKTKASSLLVKKIEQNQEDLKIQQAFVNGQDDEKKRVNQRFDEELSRLIGMWTMQAGGKSAAQKK